MKYRLIETSYNDAFYNMAVDEALMRLSTRPVLRFYRWKPAAVSLGFFQDINDLNLKFCKKNKIDIVRRITGGKAVFHDNELTYSFVIAEEKMPKNVIDSYKIISKGVLIALNNLGINARFKDDNIKKSKTPVCLANPSWYEVIVDNKKIAAAAQTRKNGKLLQHGPILFNMDYKKYCSIFKNNSRRLLEETKKRITSLNEYKKISYENLKKELIKGFQDNFITGFAKSELTEEEKELVKKLVKEKYSTDKWNSKG